MSDTGGAIVNRLPIIVLIFALIVGLTGCQSASDKVGEEIGEAIVGGAIGGDVEVDGGSVTIETEDGDVTMSGGEGSLVEGFPGDFPIYDGVTIDSSTKFAGDGQSQYYAMMLTSDEVSEVSDWYKSELASEGWSIESDTTMSTGDGDMTALMVKKGNSEASLSISNTGGETEIVVTVIVSE